MKIAQILKLLLILNLMTLRFAMAETTESIWDAKISLEKTNNMSASDVFANIENKSKKIEAKYQGIQIKVLGFNSEEGEGRITLPSPLNLTLMQAVSNICLVTHLSYQFYGNVALIYAKSFGTKTIGLTGDISNAEDGSPIREISVEVNTGRNVSVVISTNGDYICLLDIPYVYTKGICLDNNEEGMDEPSVKLLFKAPGYKTKEIELRKEKLLFNHPNIIDLRLEPIGSNNSTGRK